MHTEILTRLNANTQDMMRIPGGLPAFTDKDILFAMSGSPEGMWRLALYKLCGISEEKNKLYYALSVAAAGKQSIRNWVLENKGNLEPLCRLAVDEILATNKCKPCKGTSRRVLKDDKIVNCEFCNGTGYKAFNAKVRAKKFGVKRSDWVRYVAVYNQIFGMLVDWEGLIKQRLRERLG